MSIYPKVFSIFSIEIFSILFRKPMDQLQSKRTKQLK